MEDWRSYDDVAEIYARVHDPRFEEVAVDMVSMAGIGAGERVLDVGTGTGAVARAARAAGGAVVGIDPSLGMLGAARRTSPGIRLVAAQAIDLPFRPGAFDAVTMGFVLAHFTKPETALFDISRVLRPGARVAVSAWADGRDALTDTWLGLIHGVVPRDMLEPSVSKAIPNHERFRRPAVVEQVLRDAGLTSVWTKREVYEWDYPREAYVDGLQTWATARFARSMVGETGWSSFMERAHATFASRFPDPLHDRREVILAVATKAD
jgi:ubiquinone/menaquinone biosynthesis C-methylase UbiE